MAYSVALFDVPLRGDIESYGGGWQHGCASRAALTEFVSLPVAITGPVGRPVVEPPGGSSETASTALFFASGASAGGRRA